MKRAILFIAVIGCAAVIAAPVRSMLGTDARKSEAADWNPTAADYIQDGLVAIWDGIENAGWGIHDPNATVWKDLTGNELPLIAMYAAISWGDNYAYGFKYSLEQSTTASADVSRDYSANGFTYELVTRDGVYAYPSMMSTGIPSATYGKHRFFGVAAWQPNNYYRWNAFGQDGSSVNGGTEYYALRSSPAVSCSVQPTGLGEAYIHKTDGTVKVAKLTGSATPLLLQGTGSIGVGARIGNMAHPPVYAIRLYSRALTAEEIQHNHEVDRLRFNLP